MKDFLISGFIILFLMVTWGFFLHHAEEDSQKMIHTIRAEILPDMEAGQWDDVRRKLDTLNDTWHKFRKTALYFFHTETINGIDYSVASVLKYAQAEDLSNAAGELNSMIEQLSFLTGNEKLTLQNIL